MGNNEIVDNIIMKIKTKIKGTKKTVDGKIYRLGWDSERDNNIKKSYV
jgi:hypothetical protein